jgi:peptide methionine sulfoxide reductase msrA/msrB
MYRYHQLSKQEEHVIIEHGTEPAYVGCFNHHHEPGVYLCKRCDQPLFMSSDKFHSNCGWPSFDDAFAHALDIRLDPDGRREEILCSRCHGHLGHVFYDEGFTKKNTRHCVNSVSLSFEPLFSVDHNQRAIVAGGCFWGVEALLKTLPGVVALCPGYIGGHVVDPTYEEVCTGLTHHAEAIEAHLDTRKTSYKLFLQEFFNIHDPTQLNRQGPDIGSQYRSAIYYLSAEQKQTAEDLIDALKNQGLKVVTEVSPASAFYPAENYHQNYYGKNGQAPYCHRRIERF